MNVSILIHEKNMENFTFLEENILRENHVNRKSKSLELTV